MTTEAVQERRKARWRETLTSAIRQVREMDPMTGHSLRLRLGLKPVSLNRQVQVGMVWEFPAFRVRNYEIRCGTCGSYCSFEERGNMHDERARRIAQGRFAADCDHESLELREHWGVVSLPRRRWLSGCTRSRWTRTD